MGTLRSRIRLAGIAIILVTLTIYGILSQKSELNDDANKIKITIAQFGDFFLYAPLYIALDEGYFSREGLDVTIINTGGDDKTWAAVISGSADFGVADPTFVAVSAARGQNGIVVANLVNGVPFWGITYLDVAPFTDAKSLANHSVATFPSPSTAYALQQKMFADAGLVPNIREGAFGTIIPMLKAGTADIGLELEPNVSLAVSEGAKIVYSLAERYGDFAMTGVTAKDTTATNNPQILVSLRSALQGALDLLHDEPDRAWAKLTERFPGVAPKVAREALNRALQDGVVPRSAAISREAWGKAIALRKEVGDLSGDAPYERFIWNPK